MCTRTGRRSKPVNDKPAVDGDIFYKPKVYGGNPGFVFTTKDGNEKVICQLQLNTVQPHLSRINFAQNASRLLITFNDMMAIMGRFHGLVQEAKMDLESKTAGVQATQYDETQVDPRI